MPIKPVSISVALCTYNGGAFLREQLDSIFNQTVAADEIVVCDDCSTDDTVEIIEEYRARRGGTIKLHKNGANLGGVKNFEQCIGLCKGDIIFLSDQDDAWYPFKIELLLRDFEKNKQALLIFSDGDLIDEAGKPLHSTLWKKWNFTKEMRERWRDNELAFDDLARNINRVTGATLAMRSALKEHIFPFRSNVHYWHDAWLALYAAKYHGLFFIEQSTIQYRIHTKQLVGIGNGSTFDGARPAFRRFARKVMSRLKLR
jgi:glycosyltransferase involved in cell wall biosynthesis